MSDKARPATEAADATEVTEAEAARFQARARLEAQEARQDATAARADVADTGGTEPGDDGSELGTDLLRDYVPTEGQHPFGRPGRPLARHSPFYIGFFGGIGLLTAYWLANVIASARSVLLLVVVALFIAIGLNPLVERLIRRGARRATAVAVVSLCAIVLIALFAVNIVPLLTDQVTTIVNSAPRWLHQLRANPTIHDLNERYGVIDKVQTQFTTGVVPNQAFGGLFGVGKLVLGALFSFLTVAVLTLYFLASLPQIKRACYQLVPASRRSRVAMLGDEILSRVGGYVVGAVTVATIAGLAALLFCTLIGLREYAIALAVVVGVLDFIPLIGATIGAVIVTAVGFATSPGIGIACIVFFVIYQQVENYLIYPRVMSSSVDVPGVVAVTAALVGGALLGVVGALLAIPMAAGMLLLAREVLIRRQNAT